MPKLNENYLNLKASYLFSEIAHRTAAYKEQNPMAHFLAPSIAKILLGSSGSVINAS